jgi:hypothetical protein
MSDDSDDQDHSKFQSGVSMTEIDQSTPAGDVLADVDDETATQDGTSQGFRPDRSDTEERSELEIVRAERDELEQENKRLRRQLATDRAQTRYGRIALGFALLGIVAGGGAFAFPESREVLFAIAATGVASGLLIRYLNTGKLIPARVSEEVTEPLLRNEAAVASQLDLSDKRVYLPTEAGIRLVVPETDSYDPDALIAAIDDEYDRFGADRPFVFNDSPQQSGLSLRPSAGTLLKSFIVQRDGERPETTSKAIASLQEGVTDVLELADSVETEFDGLGRVTYELEGVRIDSTSRFDPPVVSFLGAGMAWALSTPVEVDVQSVDGGKVVVTYEWDDETT